MCRASRSSSGANPGMTMASPTTRLHAPGAAEISQPNSSNNNDATGTRLRRRLSRIRQRFTSVSGLGSVRPSVGRHARQDPRRDLPIAANPAMLALAVADVVERKVLEQLDIAGQRHAHVRPFNQVVTEQRFRGKAIARPWSGTPARRKSPCRGRSLLRTDPAARRKRTGSRDRFRWCPQTRA